MQIKALIEDEDAVSPVIGVILMVAITVILAAVIGTFVLGLGDQVQNTAPQASFTFDYDGSTTLTITHDGGDGVADTSLYVQPEGSTRDVWAGSVSGSSSKVVAGDSWAYDSSNSGQDVASTDTVNVIWEASSGDDTATLGKWNGPDA